MNRTVRILLGLLTIGLVALTSCKKDNQEPKKNEGTTYVSVAIGLQSDMRAGDNEDDFNSVGKWNGKDVIESVDVYIVSKGEVALGRYTTDDFTISNESNPTGKDNQITIKPKKAIATTAGQKEVFVLLNAPAEVTNRLKQSIPNNFMAAYNKAIEDMTTGQVAKTDATKGDIIMMTNAAKCEIAVEDGVTEDVALAGTKNRASVQVKRAVARVLLTATKDTYTIKYEDGTDMGTISNITYAVAQGEKAFYLSQKKDADGVILTPAYNFMPTIGIATPNYAAQAAAYDYSDLSKLDRSALVATDLASALKIGEKSLESSAFIFEASHLFGKAGETATNYTGKFRRANTPYVLVRTKFVPAKFADEAEGNTYTEGNDFYRGENGLFYIKKENVTDETKNGVKDQKFRTYLKGKVLYYAFVNPDDVKKTLNAPAYRNNIYHISVTGFKGLGANWNPLFPEDPNDPKDNPDPKPKDDPNTPPFNPGDNNTPEETYMAVDVTVVPWNVHTYKIELSL